MTTPKRTFYLTGETTEIVDSWLRGNKIMFCILFMCYYSRLNKLICLSICLFIICLTVPPSVCSFIGSCIDTLLSHSLVSLFVRACAPPAHVFCSLAHFACPVYCIQPSVHSFVCSFIHSFICPSVCPSFRSFVCSLLWSFVHSFKFVWSLACVTAMSHKHQNNVHETLHLHVTYCAISKLVRR